MPNHANLEIPWKYPVRGDHGPDQGGHGERSGERRQLFFPKQIDHCVMFEQEISTPAMVVFLNAPTIETMNNRLLGRGAPLGMIKKRVEEFKKFAPSIVQHYEKNSKLVRIESEGTAEDVFKQVLPALAKLSIKHIDHVNKELEKAAEEDAKKALDQGMKIVKTPNTAGTTKKSGDPRTQD